MLICQVFNIYISPLVSPFSVHYAKARGNLELCMTLQEDVATYKREHEGADLPPTFEEERSARVEKAKSVMDCFVEKKAHSLINRCLPLHRGGGEENKIW